MKILHFIYSLRIGGAETFIANVLSRLNPDDYHFDFALQDEVVQNPVIADYIRKYNSTIHVLPKFPKKIYSQFQVLKKILKDNHYDCVHIHMNAAVNPVPLCISKGSKSKTKFVIHSHNTSSASPLLGNIVHKINRKLFLQSDTIYKIACSKTAGQWMFGKTSFTQIDNAIDTEMYTFDKEMRKKIRNDFNIADDDFVVGSIGRFVHQKNHSFMVEWFAEYSKSHQNSKLFLTGDGPLLSTIKQDVRLKGIEDKVVFPGLRTDVPAILSAFDCFIMPSHFEGLAFTAIEAQASGLPVIASENISKIVNLDNHCCFISLNSPYSEWNNAIDSTKARFNIAKRNDNPVKGSRFDIDVMISQIKDIYK